MIDRAKLTQRFKDYINHYDLKDPKIGLKASHSYRVAEIAEKVAKSIGLTGEDLDIAWAIGMLHDIGRFEQCRIYDTFIDSESVDHARFGCHILFGDSLKEAIRGGNEDIEIADYGKAGIREFIEDDKYDDLIHNAIYYHSDYRFPEDMDQRKKTFLQILRDADKVDILRVNVETPLEEVYNVSTKKLKSDQVTPKILENLFEKTATNRKYKETSVDNIVGHISFIFEIVYPESMRILKEQGYLYKLMAFESNNPVTNSQFDQIRKFVNDYLDEQK